MKLSPRQCRQARSLLKWNIHDLANHSRISSRRLDSFEKGTIPLHQPENTTLVKTFRDHNIEFLDDFDVRLNDKKSAAHAHAASGMGTQVTLDSEELLELAETHDALNAQETLEKEGKKRKTSGR